VTEGAAAGTTETAGTAGTAGTADTRPTKIMYVAEATAHGGRDGYVTSQDGQIELKVAMPPAPPSSRGVDSFTSSALSEDTARPSRPPVAVAWAV